MSSTSPTLSSRQRTRIFDAYRGRGHKNSNLFLVYSFKTNRDWIISSDRRLVHWIHFLETNPSVKTFDLSISVEIPLINKKKIRSINLDAEVTCSDGTKEWHEVRCKEGSRQTENSQLLSQAAANATQQIPYRIYSDQNLSPHSITSIRWLRAISYSSVLRDTTYPRETMALVDGLERLKRGSLRAILLELSHLGSDESVLIGVFVRHAILGMITLDLTKYGFSYGTQWQWNNSFQPLE